MQSSQNKEHGNSIPQIIGYWRCNKAIQANTGWKTVHKIQRKIDDKPVKKSLRYLKEQIYNSENKVSISEISLCLIFILS